MFRATAVAAAGVLTHRRALARQTAFQAGDRLRLAGPSSGLAALDPALSRDLDTNFLLRQVFRGLMALDADLDVVPELAGSVEVSTDRLTYTFTLRPEARFHDGRTITAVDVAASWARALSPATVGGDASALAGAMYLADIDGAAAVLAGEAQELSGVRAVDAARLEVTLIEPSPTFLLKLASVPASVVDTGKPAAEQGGELPNGSGPFRVSGWDTPDAIALDAAETWWEGPPTLLGVDVRLGAAASQPFNLFQAGEIDVLPDVPASAVDLVRDPASGLVFGELLETIVFATSYIALGNAAEPLDDVHVRRALQAIFPAHQIAEASFDGAVIPATGLLPPGMLDQDWTATIAEVSVDRAQQELAASRYRSAINFPPIPIYAADIDAVEALRDVAMNALGLTVEAVQVAWPDFISGLAQRAFPAYGLYWGADYPDPEAMLGMLFESSASENYTGYRSTEFDSLLAEARVTEGDARLDAFRRANQLLIDDVAVLPLYHPRGYTLVREGIASVEVTPMGIMGLESVHAG
jgi:ABC-type transport system substrate-binding protein